MENEDQFDEIKKQMQQTSQELRGHIDDEIANHTHDGNRTQVIQFDDIFHFIEPVNVYAATIAVAAGTNDAYFIAPSNGKIVQIDFSSVDALAASDTNYITWTIVNLGQAGAGTTAILATAPTDINTTKAPGGSAISANTKRTLRLAGEVSDTQSVSNLDIVEGDRIRIRATVTGTLANTVTFPAYLIQVIRK